MNPGPERWRVLAAWSSGFGQLLRPGVVGREVVGQPAVVGVGDVLDRDCRRIPRSAATLPRLLKGAGYSTMAVGKWHLVPGGERSAAGPFDRWPLGMGFERFYGFLQGATNQWTPNLVSDNHYVDPPRRPEEGYHLTEDMADTAIRMITDQQVGAPGKPFFLYFAPGAMHSPHHVTPKWVEPYEGRCDGGWERWRQATYERQVAMGVVPSTTRLTERPDWVASWDTLSDEERRMHARAMEVFGGFLTHTDAQIGRLTAALDRLGVLDNTILLLLSDNGASAEGEQRGTSNELGLNGSEARADAANLAALDDWGGFRSHNHYGWGWAWAGNTPFKLWKRYSWLGGTRTPLVVHWPKGIEARGEVRDQFCHAVDLMPTVLDACGVEVPDLVDGVGQLTIDGASIRATFDDPSAPAPRRTQYFEMIGSRSIVHGEWRATTDHVSTSIPAEAEALTGSRDFADDHWSLFDLSSDFSEAVDVSADHPETVRELQELWLMEAGRNNVMPLSDNLIANVGARVPRTYPVGSKVVLHPVGSAVHEECLPFMVFGFRIDVEVEVPDAGAEGVLVALGDWNRGYGLYVVDGELRFTMIVRAEPVTLGASSQLSAGAHTLSVEYTPDRGEAASLRLLCDDEQIGSMTTDEPIPFVWYVQSGAMLRIGRDAGFPVSDAYDPPFPWTGTIEQVSLSIPDPSTRGPVTDFVGMASPELRTALEAD